MKTTETPLTAIAGAIFAPVALPLVCAVLLAMLIAKVVICQKI